jgi:Flp pilus assembly protein TadG
MHTLLRSRFFARLRSDGGAALAEFTLVLPVLLLVLFGIIDFGKALNYYIDQTHIANTTARYAAVNVNPGGGASLQAWAKTLADSQELRTGGTASVASPGVRVCITPGSAAGQPVTVEARSTYHLIPFIGDNISIGSMTIRARATMRMETAATNYSSTNNPAGC